MEFQYTLEQEDYLDYCKYEIFQDPSTRKLQHRCWLILPVILAILLIGFRPAFPLWYVLAVAASLLWIWLVNFLVGRIIQRGARDKCGKLDEGAYQPLRLELLDGCVKVNGKKKGLKNYLIFSASIFLFLADGTAVILPSRVFGSDRESLGRILEALKACMK